MAKQSKATSGSGRYRPCVKAIFFDLDNTLLHFARDYRSVLAEAFQRAAGECRDDWIDSYNRAFFDLHEDCEPDPYRRAFRAVGADCDPDAFVEALREAEVETCRPPENARADLARLAGDHRLGVLTDGVTDWQRHKLRAHDLADVFDAVVVSYEVGSHKPDVAPYRLAEDRLPADAHAMVGDSDSDVEGAENAGWATYRYDGRGFGDLPEAIEWD